MPMMPEQAHPELIIALVGFAGTNLRDMADLLAQDLDRVGYETHHIRLSALLPVWDKYADLEGAEGKFPEDERITRLMDAGDDLRRTLGRGDALAILAINQIREIRLKQGGNAVDPVPKTAFILNSLKHPDEIKSLRTVYGHAFLAFAFFSPRETRLGSLATRIAKSRSEPGKKIQYRSKAEGLIFRDEKDPTDEFGQNVRDSIPESDLFVRVGTKKETKKQFDRLIRLIFGDQFVTPTKEEYGMFHAAAASLRSADLSRQVGAVIMTNEGEIISAGCNEVPRRGGAYWENSEGDNGEDNRDHAKGFDASAEFKKELVAEVLNKLKKENWLKSELAKRDPYDLTESALAKNGPLWDTRVSSLLEFGRAVHAEMAAITDAARRGVPITDQVLFCTTFPCHMCARHIIASGIKKIFYLQPYPKSMAFELHEDSLYREDEKGGQKVEVSSFIGVAPRRYFDLFTMGVRKDERGDAVKWSTKTADFRLKPQLSAWVYSQKESAILEILEESGLNLGD